MFTIESSFGDVWPQAKLKPSSAVGTNTVSP